MTVELVVGIAIGYIPYVDNFGASESRVLSCRVVWITFISSSWWILDGSARWHDLLSRDQHFQASQVNYVGFPPSGYTISSCFVRGVNPEFLHFGPLCWWVWPFLSLFTSWLFAQHVPDADTCRAFLLQPIIIAKGTFFHPPVFSAPLTQLIMQHWYHIINEHKSSQVNALKVVKFSCSYNHLWLHLTYGLEFLP